MKKWIFAAIVATLSLTAYSFDVDGTRWPTPQTLMYTGIPGTSASGQTWSQALRDAAQEWTDESAFTFVTSPRYLDPCIGYQANSSRAGFPTGRGDGLNGADFTSTVCGNSYGTNVLAVTLVYSESNQLGNEITEADIVFNKNASFDIYDGPVRSGAIDFTRVALHELGHVIGMGHERGRNVQSIMRTTIGNIFTLQPDDIAGAAQLYNGFSNCPVRTLDFGVVTGALANGDCTIRRMLGSPDDSFVDVYQFELRQITTVTLRMTSPTLDSVLVLMGSNSEVLQIDDDGGQGCDARISRILQPGTYAVLANTFVSDTNCGSNLGAYSISANYVSMALPVVGRPTSFLGGSTAATFSGGVTLNKGASYRNAVSSRQRFDVVGKIDIDPAHRNKPGFIVVAALLDDGQILVKHPALGFVPYDPQASLLPFSTTKILAATENVDILPNTVASQLGLSRITVKFLMGYGLTDNPAELYFHEEPISLVVTP